MNVDKERLKALADATREYLPDVADPQMIVDTSVVLALLTEIEGLHAQRRRDSGELRKLCSARDSARRQRNQLKAENEALRIAARWTIQVHRDPGLSHEIKTEEWLADLESAMAKE